MSCARLGYTVMRNKPYAGGFITEHYGDPGQSVSMRSRSRSIAASTWTNGRWTAPALREFAAICAGPDRKFSLSSPRDAAAGLSGHKGCW